MVPSVSMTPEARPAGLSIHVTRETWRRIRRAAASRDQSIPQYVTEAIEARLEDDLTEWTSIDPPALKLSADPVLEELWDNPADARYDDL